MDPQPPPTAPSPASLSQHHRAPPSYNSPESAPRASEHSYNEKDGSPVERGSKRSTGRSHDSVISHPFSPKPSSPPSPRSSISSAGHQHRPVSGIQQSPPLSIPYPSQVHLDLEKATGSQRSPRSADRVSSSNPDVTAVLYDSSEYHEKAPEDKALHLLLYLSGPCALLSCCITIWTVFGLMVVVLLQPLRLCTTRSSLGSEVTKFLAPSLNLQRRMICSYWSATYSPAMLVVVNLLSPLVATWVAMASWTAAFFWFFSAILGDPAGQDGHNDGRESIVGVRNWWERWLSKALRGQ